MKTKTLKSAAITLLPVAALALTGCWTAPTVLAPASGNPSLVGSMVVVESFKTTATVESIDAAERKIVLKRADGVTTTLKAGDQVKATVVEETAVYLKPAGSPESVTASVVVTRAKTGAMPGVKAVDTRSFTGKVLSIDPVQHQVTLQLVGGQIRTVRMNDFVNLADFNPGDDVSVRITESMVIAVEKL